MLADPLPIDASYITAADIPAVSRDTNSSKYRLTVSTTKYDVTISHTYKGGRRRSMVRLDAVNVIADPYVTGNNVEDTTSIYLVIDRSERLVSDTLVVSYVKELLGGVMAFATAANAVTTRTAQIVAGES
jgi:hypothetical protein